MVSPPSPMLAYAWMSTFDSMVRNNASLYSRYMNDVLRDINKTSIDQTLEEINSLSLKFIEREVNCTIPFLTRLGNRLESTWFKKVTDTSLLIESIRRGNFTKYLFLGVCSPGKFDLFLWHLFLLENLMCSNEILDKISWKFWCVLVHFASPGKFICVFIPFLVLLENLMCSYKRIMSSPGKLEVFFLHPSLLENLMCSL